ncbi:hypothetical protein BOX15_Mlig017207g2 [Macrostomum lignano]|uniref:Ig-like domain-containing protein n=1 Tax=Macrostomum lignano TaxID=282301 RepID=A0A267EGG9_9PLAT|nr:hypothetical protein BOX15_Mlig017207g2 [Macrostomum lignano]
MAWPQPRIQWLRNGQSVETVLRPEDYTLTSDKTSLILLSVNSEDSGIYTCLIGEDGRAKNFTLTVQYKPEVDRNRSSKSQVIAEKGKTLVLVCSVSGYPDPEITWYKGGAKVTRGAVSNRGQKLEIISAKLTDAGDYQCFAQNLKGIASHSIGVTVKQAPTLSDLAAQQMQFFVSEMRQLHCNITGNPRPTYQWKYNGRPLPPDSAAFPTDEGASLIIPEVRLANTGIYTCSASNDLGTNSRDIRVVVVPKPKIQPPTGLGDSNRKIVRINSSMVLDCRVSEGVAAGGGLEVTWLKDNVPVNPDVFDNVEIITNADGSKSLKIGQVRQGDSGRYRCVVKNKAGTDSIFIDVVVHNSPVIEIFTPNVGQNETYSHYPGNGLTFYCSAIGVPRPTIRWLKNGRELPLRSNRYSLYDSNKRMQLHRAEPDDQGTYTCEATNTVGTARESVEVAILMGPKLRDPTSAERTINKRTGERVSLFCDVVDGYPKAKISWRRNGVELEPGADPRASLSEDRKILTISGLSSGDAGEYLCSASNRIGQATSKTRLIIADPPQIDRSAFGETARQVLRNRGAVIRCSASGSPQPTISWFKDGAALTPDSRRLVTRSDGQELEIVSVGPESQGVYRCEAVNGAGRDSAEVRLTVVEAPSIDEANLVYDMRGRVDKPAVVECPVRGTPPIAITWKRNRMPLNESARIRIENNGQRVTILRSEVSDTAEYSCTAENRFGRISRSFNLMIMVPPTFVDASIGPYVLHRVVENSSLVLDCTATGIPAPNYLWTRNSGGIISSTLAAGAPAANPALSTDGSRLSFSRIGSGHADNYTCAAHNAAARVSRYFKLVVITPPALVEGSGLVRVTVREHEFTRLRCTPDGSSRANVIWFKDDQPIPSTSEIYRLTDSDQTLMIISPTRDESGAFQCQLINEAGSVSKTYQVIVQVAPRFPRDFIAGPETKSHRLNDAAELDCPAQGNPEPRITWIKNGIRLSVDDPRYQFLENGRRLRIRQVSLDDASTFSCEASNMAGEVTKTYDLQVVMRPSIRRGLELVRIVEGEDIRLRCDFKASPTPITVWKKDGRQVASDGRVQVRPETLIISRANDSDAGVYTCEVRNNIGSDMIRIEVVVQIKPRINARPYQIVQAKLNYQIELDCSVTGDPRPTIVWKKGTMPIEESANYRFNLERQRLLITNLEASHAGLYTCEATNPAGVAFAQFQLKIMVEPKIREVPSVVKQAFANQDVTLECQATGDPVPLITWQKNGAEIPRNDPYYRTLDSGNLHIPYVRTTDSGTFLCVAKNDAGSDTQLRMLEILERPTASVPNRLVTIVLVPGSPKDEVLTCEVSGTPQPNVSWRRDGVDLVRSSPRFVLLGGSNLKIVGVRQDDEGKYVCQAESKAGKHTADVYVRTFIPPNITEVEVSGPEVSQASAPFYNFYANTWMQLSCRTTGKPTPRVVWYHNGTRKRTENSIDGTSTYLEYHLGHSDAGLYECEAANDNGVKRKIVANVRVMPAPEVLRILQSDGPVTEHSTLTLTCLVKGQYSRILWIKNGQQLVESSRIVNFRNGTLIIYQATKLDAGMYTCVAMNPGGDAKGRVLVQVWTKPFFTHEPADTAAASGDRILLDCRAKGTPVPRLSWLKDSNPFTYTDRHLRHANGSLTILVAKVTDSGVYQCVAENRLGSVESHAAGVKIYIDGGFSDWSQWSNCSVSCGSGIRLRQRRCDNPAPANGGRFCSGPGQETLRCLSRFCPIDAGWSRWGDWEPCSASCGLGVQLRQRRCDNPPAQYDGRPCDGSATETRPCGGPDCPLDGAWSAWSAWSACDRTCGGVGFRDRRRRCNSPSPVAGGRQCPGSDAEYRACDDLPACEGDSGGSGSGGSSSRGRWLPGAAGAAAR